MNWIATRFEALVEKVETALTAHSALAARVTALEELTAEPAPKAAAAEATPAAGG